MVESHQTVLQPSTPKSNILAICLVLASVSMIALSAYFAKRLIGEMPSSQILWLRFAGYVVLMAIPTIFLFSRELRRPHAPLHHVMRGLLAIAVAYSFLLALERMQLTETMAVFYVFPLLGYVGGVLVLGERSRLALWVTIAIGFCGVLIFLRPQAGAINIGVILALAAAVFASGRILFYRNDAGRTSVLVASFWERAVGFAVLSVIAPLQSVAIQPDQFFDISGLIISGILAQILLVWALARGSIGALAPFFYWELIFAVLLDVAFLGTRLDMTAIFGVGLIFACGVGMAIISQRHHEQKPG
ncbi:MAG: DMT family transporter [Pseudomonadota bacterium]